MVYAEILGGRQVKQAQKFIDEINRKKEAVYKTKSIRLINDYRKSIRSDILELRDYCKFKGIDFNEIARFIR